MKNRLQDQINNGTYKNRQEIPKGILSIIIITAIAILGLSIFFTYSNSHVKVETFEEIGMLRSARNIDGNIELIFELKNGMLVDKYEKGSLTEFVQKIGKSYVLDIKKVEDNYTVKNIKPFEEDGDL